MISFDLAGKNWSMPESPTWGTLKRFAPFLKKLVSRPEVSEKLKELASRKASEVETTIWLISFWLEDEKTVNAIISNVFRDETGECLPVSLVDDIPPEMGSVAINFFLSNMNGLLPSIQKSLKLAVQPRQPET